MGSGAFGSVKTLINKKTNKEFAVKLVTKNYVHNQLKFMQEMQIYKISKHQPNIGIFKKNRIFFKNSVQFIEWFEDKHHFYMVLEKIHGGTLLNHIQREVCFAEPDVTMITHDIANALKFMHNHGIAHRDIKPG